MTYSKTNIAFCLILLCINSQQARDETFTDKRKYPNRKSIKGLQPDFQDINQIIGNAVHTVAFNLVWSSWQPILKKGSCSPDEFLYNELCYKLDQASINAIRQYTNAEVMVTGILIGVPEWARRSCTQAASQIFCAPTDEGSIYYGLFAQFMAYYFNGENGNGRIADFVIHNEVNAIEWFNFGCNDGDCNVDIWTAIYAQSYNMAYDGIKKEQKIAKVLISLEHDFYKELDFLVKSKNSVISCETFLEKLIPQLGNREWRLAFHSYPPNLLKPEFGADDYPDITFGNIGALLGWLHKNYPDKPYTWEVQLTENGINAIDDSMYVDQRNYLCQAFKNILGTPGVESFIYHRLIDHEEEIRQGLALGLWRSSNSFKPAWELFALVNRNDVGGNHPSCGFELLPYVEMVSGYNGQFHYVSTRNLPLGFKKVKSFKILRESKGDETKLVYECRIGGAKGSQSFISFDHNCENMFNMGPMGYLYNNKVENSIPIYRCVVSTGDHFISSNENCDGEGSFEAFMGFGFAM